MFIPRLSFSSNPKLEIPFVHEYGRLTNTAACVNTGKTKLTSLNFNVQNVCQGLAQRFQIPIVANYIKVGHTCRYLKYFQLW